MIYLVIATHNPQDFFNGNETDEFYEYHEVNEKDVLNKINECTNGGYKVIVYGKKD
jgi:hypothetical protein